MTEALYGDRAGLYDVIYAWKDYPAEGARLHAILAAEGVAEGARVVEVACGTGKHLAELKQWYAVYGFDRSEEMLAVARERLPDVPLGVADMRDPVPGPPADALLCLFSSIGYLLDLDALSAALGAFAASVRPGGVVVIEPWLAPEDLTSGHVNLQHTDTPTLKVCRMAHNTLQDGFSVMDFSWLVGRPNRKIEHFTERHVMWPCARPVFAAALDAAGLDARFEADGLMPKRGLWIARRR